jgi:hypothetical protein
MRGLAAVSGIAAALVLTLAGAAAPRAAAAPPTRAAAAGRTSCRSVAHIGDSTSADLISSADLPDPAQQLPAQYTDVGVRHLLIDASGGRSVVETLPGQVNGYNVALAWWQEGYRGCWVFALGTNDAADVAAGSNVGMMARIQEMMSVAHGEPVMWVNTVTQLTSGPMPRPTSSSGTTPWCARSPCTPTCASSTGQPWHSPAGSWRTGFTTTPPDARSGPRPSPVRWHRLSRCTATAEAPLSANRGA